MHTFQDFHIPKRMAPGIHRYINYGTLPGDFLRAVICNKLKEAVMYADYENMHNLPAYVDYFYNKAPMGCWGSEERMHNWVKQFKKEVGSGKSINDKAGQA